MIVGWHLTHAQLMVFLATSSGECTSGDTRRRDIDVTDRDTPAEVGHVERGRIISHTPVRPDRGEQSCVSRARNGCSVCWEPSSGKIWTTEKCHDPGRDDHPDHLVRKLG